MQKALLILVVVLITAATGWTYLLSSAPTKSPAFKPTSSPSSFDATNAAFTIDGREVRLRDGLAQEPAAAGSATQITTRYFGNESRGDLNGDGKDDIAYLVRRDGGGSGDFFYVIVALSNVDGYRTTNAFLVGDRIAPQSTSIQSDSRELHVYFAERKEGEPMTTPPSVGAVLLLKVTQAGVLEGLMK